MRGAYSLDLPTQTETLVPLPQALDVHSPLLEGEIAGGTMHGGHVIQFAARMAELHVNQPVAAFSNLKLRLLRPTGAVVPGDLFAKVVETQPEDTSPGHGPFHVAPRDSSDVFGYHKGYEYHVINRDEQV
jgi:hypothetical protein